MRPRRVSMLGWLLVMFSPAAAADTLRFAVTPGQQVEASVTPEGRLRVQRVPGGAVQTLQAPVEDWDGKVDLGHDDYDFDGRQDLVLSTTLGQVNIANLIYRFDPATQRFVRLAVPTNAPTSCEGFWDLTRDKAARTLTSSCRSGPMWYTDVYRYTDTGRLYVYQSQQRLENFDVEQLRMPSSEGDGLPLSRWTTYDADGRALRRHLGETPGGIVMGAFSVPKVALHQAPRAGRSQRYLLAGDRFELLDIDPSETWLQVRYLNPKRGAITGWLRIAEAIGTP